MNLRLRSKHKEDHKKMKESRGRRKSGRGGEVRGYVVADITEGEACAQLHGWVGGRMNGEEREVRESFAFKETHGGQEGETP